MFSKKVMHAGSVLLLCLLNSCLAHRDQLSIWPPEDFYLEVRGVVTDASGSRQKQQLQVWADGLMVYRQAARDLPNCPIPIPLFTEVCAYRLDPETIRSLSRKLHLRHLYDLDEIRIENQVMNGEHAVIIWHAREQEGRISSMSPTTNLDPVLNLINSFLPEGHGIVYDDLAGSLEVREVMQVPTPVDSLSGALAFHVELADAHVENQELTLHTFALAIAGEDWQEARKRLAIIETYRPSAVLGEILPDADWQRDFLEVLRGMVK